MKDEQTAYDRVSRLRDERIDSLAAEVEFLRERIADLEAWIGFLLRRNNLKVDAK